jgi:hypothetical protein
MDIDVTFEHRGRSTRLVDFARRTLAQALDRFGARIRAVRVRFRDENGKKGGVDQHCALALQIHGGGSLHLHETDASAETALHRVAARAARLVREAFARRRERRG